MCLLSGNLSEKIKKYIIQVCIWAKRNTLCYQTLNAENFCFVFFFGALTPHKNSKAMFWWYLVGGQTISCYEQENEKPQNSEPKQIRINQHLGALFWKHEMPYIKPGGFAHSWLEQASESSHIALHGLSTMALGLQLSPMYITLLSQ